MAELKLLDQKPARKSRETVDPQGSTHSGAFGLFERTLRRFKNGVHGLTLIPFYGIAALCLGIAGTPGVALVQLAFRSTRDWSDWTKIPPLDIP